MRLLRLSKVNAAFERGEFPLRASTLYHWNHVRKHPEIFIKVGSAAFIDLDRFDALLESGRGAVKKPPKRGRQ
jgi:hypothetical protein